MDLERHTGRCLCEGVRYEVLGPLPDIITCHCSQCRRTSGHYFATTRAQTENLHLIASETLTWYRASDFAERGFCSRCGGNLCWRPIGGKTTSILAGTLDPPTHLRIGSHIFVADKSDYYEIDDDAPQSPGY